VDREEGDSLTNYVEQAATERVRPAWIEDLVTFHRGRIARQFVLHFNIVDIVIDMSRRRDKGKGEYIRLGDVVGEMKQLPTMREYLHQYLFDALHYQAIYTYSLAGGLIANDRQQGGIGTPLGRELRGPAIQRLYEASKTLQLTSQGRGQPVEGKEVDLPDNIAENFKLLGHVLRQQYYEKPDTSSTSQATAPKETPIAVILDYAEKLIPFNLDEGQGDREQLQALEVVQRWALDPLIRKTDNIIILLTTNIGQIPPSVYAEGSGCRAIRVPLPDEHERAAFIRFKMTTGRPKLVPLHSADFGATLEGQAAKLARITQGMRLTDIDNVSRRVYVEFQKSQKNNAEQGKTIVMMKAEDVQRAKAEVIQAQSAQLLEIVPPVRGFNEIGGLENLKQYLRKRTSLMSSRDHSPLVPSGLLLAGPPGTGKTIIAEALALESGFNLVKMRNIQDKWIGSSERNLELVLNLLKDLHPVVVFVDEIDQAMVRRDTGQSGDSGVGARMFARILEEMSNAANRGNILWVAATNRADIIDAALLRRFDRVVPLLTPDVHESCRIFATMVNTIVKQSGGNIKVAYDGDLTQSGRRDAQERPDPTEEDLAKFSRVAQITSELGITGAGIEIIVRRAIEMAYEEMFDAGLMLGGDSLSLIELHHLQAAIRDFKPNYNRVTYDYQSLLALRACNFHSIIPPLPKGGVFGRVQNEDGRIDPDKLEAEIVELERRSNNAKKSS
jgi:SpoVK/Ycf46/Vps4 family AAA+-type ATPase